MGATPARGPATAARRPFGSPEESARQQALAIQRDGQQPAAGRREFEPWRCQRSARTGGGAGGRVAGARGSRRGRAGKARWQGHEREEPPPPPPPPAWARRGQGRDYQVKSSYLRYTVLVDGERGWWWCSRSCTPSCSRAEKLGDIAHDGLVVKSSSDAAAVPAHRHLGGRGQVWQCAVFTVVGDGGVQPSSPSSLSAASRRASIPACQPDRGPQPSRQHRRTPLPPSPLPHPPRKCAASAGSSMSCVARCAVARSAVGGGAGSGPAGAAVSVPRRPAPWLPRRRRHRGARGSRDCPLPGNTPDHEPHCCGP